MFTARFSLLCSSTKMLLGLLRVDLGGTTWDAINARQPDEQKSIENDIHTPQHNSSFAAANIALAHRQTAQPFSQ
jgi:hypothetical protein